MNQSREIRIFLSSPGDVAEERRLAQIVIERLKYDRELRDKVSLKAIAWDDPNSRTPMLATMSPQDAINNGLALPSECDIVIVIFWSRMGTKLTHKNEDYESGTHFEFMDAIRAADRSQNIPAVLLYRRTQKPSLIIDDTTTALEQIDQIKRVQTFFEGDLFKDQYQRILRGYNPYETPEQFEDFCENDLKKIIQMLLSDPKIRRGGVNDQKDDTEFVLVPFWEGSPFPGLRSFDEGDESIFFGRARETAEVIDLLRKQQFISVIGSSGSGKSSLIGAGVLPKLRKNVIDGSRDWVIIRFTPGELGSNPLIALADRVRINTPSKLSWSNNFALASALTKEPNTIHQLVDEVLEGLPDWTSLLLFIDQFEELITLIDENQRKEFIRVLEEAQNNSRLKIITTIRADFYQWIVENESLASLLNEGTYALSTPGPIALLDMITRPADRAGLHYEAGLAELILKDTGSDSGALALLAFALDELYKLATSTGQNELSIQNYNLIGTVQGAIGKRATAIFEDLSLVSKSALTRVFQELITVDERGVPTRQRTYLAQFNSDPAALDFIKRFTDERLLTSGSGENNLPTVEVAHEALLRSWILLATWVEEVQDDLRLQDAVRRAAIEWNKNERNSDYLWPSNRLIAVNEMMRRCEWIPNVIVKDFMRSETERWLETLQQNETSIQTRVEIGLQLAVLPDPRPGVGVIADNTPDIAWCAIEHQEHQFQVACYPVTVQQYRAFIRDENGYYSSEWWDKLSHQTSAPVPSSNFGNYPMNNVSWYEATAFCRWLSVKIGKEIRLPTIAEWKIIASQISSQVENKITGNTLETNLKQPVAVGLFAPDIPLLQIYDLQGNVREWGWNQLAAKIYNRTGSISDKLYPLFGNSWGRLVNATSDVMSADPSLKHPEWGFRVVMGSLPTEKWVINQEAANVENTLPTTAFKSKPIHEISSQRLKAPRHNWPEWARTLPTFSFKRVNHYFQLINPSRLEALLYDHRQDITVRINDDMDFLEKEFMHLFRTRDHEAAFQKNRYLLTQIGVIIAIILFIIIGTFTLLENIDKQIAVMLTLIITVLIIIVSYLINDRSRSVSSYGLYIDNRRRAEFLRREYFRYLINLRPYNKRPENIFTSMQAFSSRVADINRGFDTRNDLESENKDNQPAYLFFDRETDEAYAKIFDHFLVEDSLIFYENTLRNCYKAFRQCSRFTSFFLILVGLFTSLASSFSISLVLLFAFIGAGLAIFFTVLPLLNQWERLITIYESSLKNLKLACTTLPRVEQQIDDMEYRMKLENYAESVLRVLEDEANQFGQMVRKT